VYQEFNNHINKNFAFLRKSKILIAISGGIDSVILTHLLQQLNFAISLAHCNFNLRGEESNKDEKFVRELAKNLKVPVFIKSFKTKEYAKENKLSIQETARNLRYNWFEELLKQNNLDYVLTAHNLNDNLETFLINFTRGTGLQGLTGIPVINNKTVRPLLEFSREHIENFAKENNINWREDQSNANTKYTRNKIRHKVLPILKEINPNILDSFKNTTLHLKDSEKIINEKVTEVREEIFNINKSEEGRSVLKLNIQKIQNLKHPKVYLYELLKEYGFTEWNDILNLLTTQSGKQIFSKTHRLIKDRDYLLLAEVEKAKSKKQKVFSIEENDTEFNIQNQKFKVSVKLILNNQSKTFNPKPLTQNLIFDKDLLKFPLKVRKWQNGDYFYPIGMTGKKKLSKFFKDEKYSLLEKENIWLLLSDTKIVWVIGKRQDNRFKVTDKTSQILEISY